MRPGERLSRLDAPGPTGRGLLAVAAAVWTGVVVGARWSWPAFVVLVPLVGLSKRRTRVVLLALCAVAAGIVSGAMSVWRAEQVHAAELPAGRVAITARMATDPLPARFGWRQVVVPETIEVGGTTHPWQGPPLVVEAPDASGLASGSRVELEGVISPAPGWVRGRAVAGRMRDPALAEIEGPSGPLLAPAQMVRDRILGQVGGGDPGRALLAGFLVGETSALTSTEVDVLRRAGLSHFVAVSGSNVATFLVLWWLVLAPVSRYPRLRAVAGLIGVALFAVVTRAEPSVVRAGAMVAVLLVGRALGWPFDRWSALGIAVVGCLLLDGRLGLDVGFQLSVAATAGVMAGAGVVRFGPKALATVAGASISAQVAVAPLLLATFGALPILSPLANLVASPLVAASTMVGGVGALAGVGPLVSIGAWLARVVLWVGHVAAPWPQIGPSAAAGVAAAALVVWRVPVIRPAAALTSALIVAVILVPLGPSVDVPAVVFLDVGQGDATLVLADGVTILVDGGPDPVVLRRKLDHYRVDRIDLLVVSHVHADHIEGLRAVVGTTPVGAAWTAFDGHDTPASRWLTEALADAGIPNQTPPAGSVVEAGGLAIEVLAPRRRYASPNDQSIVLMLRAAGRSFLLSGDIEVVAQRELGVVNADVLKVPHQGAATSDPDWIAAAAPELAIVFVGPNDYGHPADWVIESLESSGAIVKRTDRDGDIVVEP